MPAKTQPGEPGLPGSGLSPAPHPADVHLEGLLPYPEPVRKVLEEFASNPDHSGIVAGRALRDIANATGLPLTVVGMAVRVLERRGVLVHFFDLEGRSVWGLPDAGEPATA